MIYIDYQHTDNYMVTINLYYQLVCFVFYLLVFTLQPGDYRSGASSCGYRNVCANTLSEDPWRAIQRGDFHEGSEDEETLSKGADFFTLLVVFLEKSTTQKRWFGKRWLLLKIWQFLVSMLYFWGVDLRMFWNVCEDLCLKAKLFFVYLFWGMNQFDFRISYCCKNCEKTSDLSHIIHNTTYTLLSFISLPLRLWINNPSPMMLKKMVPGIGRQMEKLIGFLGTIVAVFRSAVRCCCFFVCLLKGQTLSVEPSPPKYAEGLNPSFPFKDRLSQSSLFSLLNISNLFWLGGWEPLLSQIQKKPKIHSKEMFKRFAEMLTTATLRLLHPQHWGSIIHMFFPLGTTVFPISVAADFETRQMGSK